MGYTDMREEKWKMKWNNKIVEKEDSEISNLPTKRGIEDK